MTLIELILATSVMTVLLFALTSAILISTQALEVGREGPTSRTPETARLLEEITADLRLALQITTPLAPDEIEFTVPDRDGDDTPERIQYAWSGAPDYQLTRLIDLSNDATPAARAVLVEDVHGFDLTYLTRTWGAEPQPDQLESDEVLLIRNDDVPPDVGARVLLVVRDASSPTVQELARETMMNAWGHTVSRITAGATPAAYDTAVAAADVVYISEEVDSSDVGTKLRDAAIGVVNEEINLVDEFGVAAAHAFPPVGAVLEIDPAPHPITDAFSPGPRLVFDSPQAITSLSGAAEDLAPDLRVLATWGGASSLSILDRGAVLAGPPTPGQLGITAVLSQRSGPGDFKDRDVAMRVDLASGARITALSAYLYRKKGIDLRYAIYSDDGGEPDLLLAETPEVRGETGTGWISIALDRPLIVPPGAYWLTIGMSNDLSFHYEETGGASRYADPPGTDFASTWTGTYGPDPNERRLSVYADYEAVDFAAGRRVTLPWGGNAFDISSLTDDGRTLVGRTIAWGADPTPDDTAELLWVGRNDRPAQWFRPALPINTTGWSVTRVLVRIRANPEEPGGKVRFRLHYATPGGQPADEIIQETAEIAASAWDPYAFQWYEIPFDPVVDLNPDNGICLVLRGANDEQAAVEVDRGGDRTSGTHLVETTNDGGSWTNPGQDDLRFYVYGRYTTAGAPIWP